ncbi:NUDIX domain-containing protein [Apibacter raozihei]|uniref:NUDIX hydrolase n=1 Tax=Apibacter raozihei TaxID=2500547 RepID=UPI000FE2B6F6|nr:NUDIX domain-containing protein [Apibacter raozihei]
MQNKKTFSGSGELLLKNRNEFLPGISVDNVIFGYHEGKIKILLNKFISFDKWMLPGGFIYTSESVNGAAIRILKERTGLEEVFLKQFHTFGDINRTSLDENMDLLNKHFTNSEARNKNHWLIQRYVSIGYYAFVDYTRTSIKCYDDEDIQWSDLDKIPALYSDHNKIIQTAIREICKYIAYIPIGYELLPEKFTMSDLRLIYEAFLGEKLDRRNFQRKMLSMGHLNKLDEKSEKRGVKPAVLFSFNKEKYTEGITKLLKN